MQKTPRGYFALLVLVFSAVFMVLIATLSGYIFVQKKVQLADENKQKAQNLAEAGLEYYRWHLAHFPTDLKDGTNAAGPYVHTVNDPEGGTLGTFSLSINGSVMCNTVTGVEITSKGVSANDPAYSRTLLAKYTKPSVAEFSTIVNSNVWAGSDRVITGPYHSNGGVRMDGVHNATVSSGVASWLCTSSFGCSPSSNKNGVFGAGGPSSLWSFPAAPIDFDGITVDLTKIKGYATSSGVYIAPSGGYGWRVTFLADGTASIRKVVGTTQVWSYSLEDGWAQERTVMSNVQAQTIYTIPASCPIVYVEDNVWVDGVVSGKVVLAAANLITAGQDRSVILNDDLTYANSASGITVIGEKDVLIGLQTPDVMDINGIFIAQKGHFGRNHYCTAECDSSHSGNEGLPNSLDQYVTRSTLNTNGTVVSNGRVGTKWTSGNVFVSGYNQRNDTYDRTLAQNPPPFTPTTSDDFKFVLWQDQNVPF